MNVRRPSSQPIHTACLVALSFTTLALSSSCRNAHDRETSQSAQSTELSSSTVERRPAQTDPHARVVEVPVPDDRPAFVLRGRGDGAPLVFLSGLCSHPAGYVMSFMHVAATRGNAIGVQGDSSCGGDGAMRSWGRDLDRIGARIDAAFQAASLDAPREITLVGYSQGAERAERLAAKDPDRFTRVILISSPVRATPEHLRKAKAVAIGIGERESHAGTVSTFNRLKAAKIPAAWFVLPGARHGEMGPEAQRVMGEVLAWVDAPDEAGTEVVRTSAPPVTR